MNTKKAVRVAQGAAALLLGSGMHSIRNAMAAVLAVGGLSIAGAASAAVIKDVINGPKEITADRSYPFLHNITDNGFAAGDPITSATLVVLVNDDDGHGKYTIRYGSAAEIFGDDERITIAITGASLADLAKTGTMHVTIRAMGDHGGKGKKDKKDKKGDDGEDDESSFRFVSSTLTVTTAQRIPAPPESSAVPEPGTLSLLGFGLAGLAVLGRRGTRRPSKSTYGGRQVPDPNPLSTSIAHNPMEAR